MGASQEVATVQGESILIKASAGAVTVNGRNVVAADNEASNGVAHIIDGVLLLPEPTPAPTPAPKNLVELAQSVGDLSALVAAVKAAGLVETLSSSGPFTVFAPTNDAFRALPAGTLASLLRPENKDTLVAILTYHVVSGKVLSTDLGASQEVVTVQGESILIKANAGAVTVNGRNVVAVDNEASNGVAHIIDGVLLPPTPTPAPTPAPKNLVELAQSVGDLSALVAAVKTAGLVETLSSSGPFTVFAPTNDAFRALPAGTLASLLLPENKDTLVALLTYHVVSGKVLSTDLGASQKVVTVQGESILIEASAGAVTVNGRNVVAADNEASNGVVHIIDGVLLLPEPTPTPDYQSRPPATGTGAPSCSNYKDTLPGAALRGQSHTVVMSLRSGNENPRQRQWILNIGQNLWQGGTGAHHWLYNEGGSNYGETGGRFSVQFGAWNGRQIKVADIQHACKTLSTVYDGPTKTYSIYVDGKLKETRAGVSMNIKNGVMAVGRNAAHPGDVNFDGCVRGVNVYRRALSPEEVLAAAEQLDSAAEH